MRPRPAGRVRRQPRSRRAPTAQRPPTHRMIGGHHHAPGAPRRRYGMRRRPHGAGPAAPRPSSCAPLAPCRGPRPPSEWEPLGSTGPFRATPRAVRRTCGRKRHARLRAQALHRLPNGRLRREGHARSPRRHRRRGRCLPWLGTTGEHTHRHLGHCGDRFPYAPQYGEACRGQSLGYGAGERMENRWSCSVGRTGRTSAAGVRRPTGPGMPSHHGQRSRQAPDRLARLVAGRALEPSCPTG